MICGLDEISSISKKILKEVPNGGIVLLSGDLASGKTTLVKNFVKEIGLDVDVCSPTFLILNSYQDRVFHYDIYMDGVKKFIQSGLLENLDKEGWHFIEWADEDLKKILNSYGYNFLSIDIKSVDDKREYSFAA